MSTAIARPKTPETRRRDDDLIFSTPTSSADLELRIALLTQRHDAEPWEPSTPKCSADVEQQIVELKKKRDDYFDDFCFIMRKAGKRMDEQRAQIKEQEQIREPLLAELADLEDESEQADQDEQTEPASLFRCMSAYQSSPALRTRRARSTTVAAESGNLNRRRTNQASRKRRGQSEETMGSQAITWASHWVYQLGQR
ncbi:hypothetical protein NCS56_01419700 [Fusarium sp. Ph1]|nr:hypothetical protein NCS56_01419700 [Fusarium sp. Ph1]